MQIPLDLRDYQEDTVRGLFAQIKRCIDPVMAELGTGAGKSFIVAGLAYLVKESSGKKVLALQPSKELVGQNHEKFLLTGEPASIYCAGLNKKDLRHSVIFASPKSIKTKIRAIAAQVGLIVVDECHETTNDIKAIINECRAVNPNVRVVGLTATPYRMGTGFIYQLDTDDSSMPAHQCINPYYLKCVARYDAEWLLERNFLTQPKIGSPLTDGYNVSQLEMGKNGKYTDSSLDRAFVGHGRKTAEVVADVVAQSQDRRGVMLFAATRQHAKEVLDSLPPLISSLIDGDTPSPERESIIERFKKQQIKYLVSVGTLTRGFDAPHVDVIALLRKTESASLLQQILGRGMRLFQGKEDFLILDYAANLEAHAPDGRIFKPMIKATIKGETVVLDVTCPMCNGVNKFSARKNDDGFGIDDEGYFTDLDGNRIGTEYGAIPAHYGRRCQNLAIVSGVYVQCAQRWTDKTCPACDASNDIAARYCGACKHELVDPNEKLTMEFKRLKRDPTRLQTDAVLEWAKRPSISAKSGLEILRVDFKTEYRKFSVWFHPQSQHAWQRAEYHQLMEATYDLAIMPDSITYQKNKDTEFFKIHGYNQGVDCIEKAS